MATRTTTITIQSGAVDVPALRPPAQPVRQHGIALSVLLHLLPGLLALGFYVLTAPAVMRWGFPPLFASVLTIPLVIVPFMLGWLALEARRTTGAWQPLAAATYRDRVPAKRLFAWTAALVVWGAVVFGITEAMGWDRPVRAALTWLPDWFLRPAEFDQIVAMQTPQLVIFLASMLFVVGVVAPAVEELYYRGHLMPALGRFGAWAPLISVALFTLYHFESPWENAARFIVVLPMAFAVWNLRSVRLGIVVHVALNTLSAVALAIAVLAAR